MTTTRTKNTIRSASEMTSERLDYWIDILSFPRAGHNHASLEALNIHTATLLIKPLALRCAVSEVLSRRIMKADLSVSFRVLRSPENTRGELLLIDDLYIEAIPAFDDPVSALDTITSSDARTCSVAVEMIEGIEGFKPSASKSGASSSSAEAIRAHQAINDHIEEIRSVASDITRQLVTSTLLFR